MPTVTWSNEPTSTVTGTLALRITFDEVISGFAAGDLRLRRTSDNRSWTPTAAQTTLTHLGNNVWEVKLSDLLSLLGEQNTQFKVRLRRRTVYYETSRQSGPNVAVDSAAFTIHTKLPFGVIGAFAHQRVTIGTEMALDINITGNPDHAYIVGLLEGFYTNWKDPILEVRGLSTRVISNVPFTVKALKGSEEPLSRAGVFSVVPAVPVITNPGKQKFVRGIENSFIVKISNSPSKVRAVGPWLGMKSGSHPDGIRIFGIVPEVSHAVPEAGQNIRVTAETGVLMDEVEIDFDLLNSYIYSADNSDAIYRIQLNKVDDSVSSDLFFENAHREIRYLASDVDYIYFGSISQGGIDKRQRVYRVPRETGNGKSVNATQIAYFRYAVGGGIIIDGNDAYRSEGGPRSPQIRVFNKSTGATVRIFGIGTNFYPRGVAIDGDDLIVLLLKIGDNGVHLRWYNKNTSNRGTATHTRELRLPNPNVRHAERQYNDITVFDGKIFVTNHTANTITCIDIESGSVIKTYTCPPSLSGMYGITIQVA